MKTTDRVCRTCGRVFQVKSCDWRLKNGRAMYCSRKCAHEANRTGENKECPICGETFYTTRNKTCSAECGRKLKSRNWNHKTYMEGGYIVEFVNGYNKKGNLKQHRRIMEEFLGRPLDKDEIVHHKNGNKTDNRIENLEVMSREQHSSLHRIAEKASGKHLFGGYHNN